MVQGDLDSGTGLLFRRQNNTLDDVYVFQIVPNGACFIGKRVDGTVQTLVPPTYSSVINTGLNAVDTHRVACQGPPIMQYCINDELVNVVAGGEFGFGKVALYAWDDPSVAVEVQFNDVQVYSISIP